MKSKPSYLPMIVSIGFLLSGLIGVGTFAWCGAIGGCKFGKYEAEITLTDAKTHAPLANRKLTARIHAGAFFFPSVEEGQTVMTDSQGQANIEFNRGFYSPLVITVFSESPETIANFGFDLKNIREDTTLTQIDTEYLSAGGAEKGKVKLLLEVGDWSLGSAQVGMVEE
jgi:hypothetical protein